MVMFLMFNRNVAEYYMVFFSIAGFVIHNSNDILVENKYVCRGTGNGNTQHSTILHQC